MSNNDGIKIPILPDDMGEGFKETWEDHEETNKFVWATPRTTDAVKILHDRYIKNDPVRMESLRIEREEVIKELVLLKESAVLIKKLWLTFRKISDIQGTKMSNEDIDLWEAMARHSACKIANRCTCLYPDHNFCPHY